MKMRVSRRWKGTGLYYHNVYKRPTHDANVELLIEESLETVSRISYESWMAAAPGVLCSISIFLFFKLQTSLYSTCFTTHSNRRCFTLEGAPVLLL